MIGPDRLAPPASVRAIREGIVTLSALISIW